MKVKFLKANQTELHLNDGTVVFISYETPVAACLGNGDGFIRSEDFHSRTTSKHINQWLSGAKAITVPQMKLDNLVKANL